MTFRLQELTYAYAGARAPALNQVTYQFDAGTTTAVLGMSGSGKTTLLSLLGLLGEVRTPPGAVLYRSSSGELDYHNLTPRHSVRLRRDHFGFVLQSAYLMPHFSCRDNVAVPLALRGVGASTRRRRVDALLERAGLAGLGDRSPRDVSGGERQRLAVLRAVVHDPHVVFADEPFSNLDPHNTRQVLVLLQAWRDGKLHEPSAGNSHGRSRTLILVSHDLRTAADLAGGRYLILRRGRLTAAGIVDLEAGDAVKKLEALMLQEGDSQ